MAWIKSEQALASHPKVHLLAKELGISVPQVIGRDQEDLKVDERNRRTK